MPRNEKYHFIYTGYDSGTHNFETVMKRQSNAPRWTAFIDTESFKSSKVKSGVFNFIIKGHFQDDSPYPKNIFFFVTDDLKVCTGSRENIWHEGDTSFPLPKYACDFLRALVKKIESWENNCEEKISTGSIIAT